MSRPQHEPPPGMTGVPSSGRGPPPGMVIHSSGYYHHLGGVLIGVPCLLLALCTAAVAGRLTARRMVKVAIEADDLFAIVALLLLVTMTAEQIALGHFVLNMADSIPPNMADLHGIGKMQIASQITYAVLMAAARLSILMLYRRIFTLQTRWFKLAWWTTVAVVIAYGLALLVIFSTQCSPHPINTLWLDPVACHTGNGYTKSKGPTIGGFINAVVDMGILVLPIKLVCGLQMTNDRKILVCGLFGLGLLGVAVSLARAIALIRINSAAGSGSVAISCWSTAEAAVALLCACLPLQRPLFSHVYERMSSSRGMRSRSRVTTDMQIPLKDSKLNEKQSWASVSRDTHSPTWGHGEV